MGPDGLPITMSVNERTVAGSPAATSYLMRSALVAALGGLLFGFDTVVISGASDALSKLFELTPLLRGFMVSTALWGTVLGALFAGLPSDRWGRLAALRGLAVLYVVTALGCACAWNLQSFLVFRFISGLAIGGSSVIGPIYIAEIAPAKKRGRLVGMFQFNIVFGIMVAYLSNYLVGQLGLGDAEWRWKLGVAVVPAVVFFFALFGIPQSPRWLMRRDRVEEARQVLTMVGAKDVEGELKDIQDSMGAEHATKSEPLFQARYKFPIFLAIAIGMFNQFSGINAILYYLNTIFQQAGFSKVSSDLQAVAIGATNLLFTIIAMLVIDKFGRKKLLLIGAVGTAVCMAGVAVVFATKAHQDMLLWLLVGFIAFFAFSQGSVIWVYLSEVFPTLVRAKGQSLGSFTHWIMNAIISLVFPVLAAKSGALPFAFFAVMTAVQFFVVLFVFPETAGVSLEAREKKIGMRGAT
jgi:SP family arabinose:H+ symporter-like MFS transporter